MLITLAGISSLIVNSSKVQAADTIKLSLNHNSYLYDKNGNLIKPKKKPINSGYFFRLLVLITFSLPFIL